MVHERRLTETMGAIPAFVGAEDRDAAEAELARHARSFNSTSLHKIGQHILDHLDPDGPEPRDEPQPVRTAGELRLWDRRDGRLGLERYLEPEHRAAFRSLIDQFARPRPATDAIPDERTAPPRSATLTRCWRSAGWPAPPRTAPAPPGSPTPHRHHRLGRPAHQSGNRDAGLRDAYQRIGGTARACDAKIIPVVLGGKSETLDVGCAMRTVPLSIRRALVARDRGCAFPGCDRPP